MAWLSRAEYDTLEQTLQALWRSRMMSALLPGWKPPWIDTEASAEVVRAHLGPGRGR